MRPARRASTEIDGYPSGGVEVGGEHELVCPDQVIVTGPPDHKLESAAVDVQ